MSDAGNEVARMLLRKKDKLRYVPHDSTFSGHVAQLAYDYIHFRLGRNVYAIGYSWRHTWGGKENHLYLLDNDGHTHSSAFSNWTHIPVARHLIDTLMPYLEEKRKQYNHAENSSTISRALNA